MSKVQPPCGVRVELGGGRVRVINRSGVCVKCACFCVSKRRFVCKLARPCMNNHV